jgi:hypothetical protein
MAGVASVGLVGSAVLGAGWSPAGSASALSCAPPELLMTTPGATSVVVDVEDGVPVLATGSGCVDTAEPGDSPESAGGIPVSAVSDSSVVDVSVEDVSVDGASPADDVSVSACATP